MAQLTPDQFAELLRNIPRADGGARLAVFTTGTSSEWLTFKDHFRIIATTRGWNALRAKRELKASVQQSAADLVADIVIVNDPLVQDLDDLITAYENRFCPAANSDMARATFMKMQQTIEESIIAWHSRLRSVFIRAYPNAEIQHDPHLINRFIMGLSDNKVKAHTYYTRPQTFADALNEASNNAAAVQVLKQDAMGMHAGQGGLHAISANIKCYICQGPHMKPNCPIWARACQLAQRQFGRGGGPGRGRQTSNRFQRQPQQQQQQQQTNRWFGSRGKENDNRGPRARGQGRPLPNRTQWRQQRPGGRSLNLLAMPNGDEECSHISHQFSDEEN